MQVLAGAGLRGCDGSSRLETISLCFGKGFPKSSCSPGQGGAAVLCEARMLPCLIFGGCHLWFRIPGLEDAAQLANPWQKPECLYWIIFYHLWVCHHLKDLPLLWQRQRSTDTVPQSQGWFLRLRIHVGSGNKNGASQRMLAPKMNRNWPKLSWKKFWANVNEPEIVVSWLLWLRVKSQYASRDCSQLYLSPVGIF